MRRLLLPQLLQPAKCVTTAAVGQFIMTTTPTVMVIIFSGPCVFFLLALPAHVYKRRFSTACSQRSSFSFGHVGYKHLCYSPPDIGRLGEPNFIAQLCQIASSRIRSEVNP